MGVSSYANEPSWTVYCPWQTPNDISKTRGGRRRGILAKKKPGM